MSALTDTLLEAQNALLASGIEIPATDLRAFESLIIGAIGTLEARARGNQIHYTAGVPADSLGLEGDLGVNQATGDFYKFEGGTFVFLFNGRGRTSAFTPVAQNQYGTHPAFTTQLEWDIWLTQNGGSDTVTPTIPGQVGTVTPTPGNHQMGLAFPLVSGATSYTAKYRATGSGAYITGVTGSGSPLTITGLANDVADDFIVIASNSAGSGTPSVAVTATPTAGISTPTLLGELYNKNSWTDLNDFQLNGGLTASIVAGKIVLSGNSASDYTKSLSMPGFANTDENFRTDVVYTYTGAAGNGLAVGKMSISSSGFIVNSLAHLTPFSGARYVQRTEANGANSTTRATGTGTPLAADTPISVGHAQAGNRLSLYVDDVEAIHAEDTFVYAADGVDQLLPNHSVPAFWNAGPATITIQSIKLTSNSLQNPRILVVGDSKPRGDYAGSYAATFSERLASLTGESVLNLSGSGDRTADFVAMLPYIQQFSPGCIVMVGPGRNDVDDAAMAANYQTFFDGLSTMGCPIIGCLPVPETAKNQSALAAVVASVHAGGTVVDPATVMTAPACNNPDNIHLIATAQNALAELVAAAVAAVL